jgi:urea carboxylase
VSEGQTLLALEAMKMEAPIVAPFEGIVTQILVKPGDMVSPSSILAVIERKK